MRYKHLYKSNFLSRFIGILQIRFQEATGVFILLETYYTVLCFLDI